MAEVEEDFGDDLHEYPPIDPLLLRKLEEHFPDRAAGLRESRDEERVKVGQVSVVRFLRDLYERQNNEEK